MMQALLLVLMIGASPLLAQKPGTIVSEPPPRAHVSNSFSFTVNAAMHDAAPLFGPESERVWAGDDWNPQFVFPIPAKRCRRRCLHHAAWRTQCCLGEHALRSRGRSHAVCVRSG